MIELRGVRKCYGSVVALRDLSVVLGDGSTTAVVGPNGSGKTTLGRILLGLERPSAGLVRGLDQRVTAAVFQENRLCGHLSAVANVRLALPRAAARDDAIAGLRAVGLDDASLSVPTRQLSGGQRRRVAIVRALAGAADLVVLDEPFVGLDTDAKALTSAWVRDRLVGRTAILITHDLDEVESFSTAVLRL